MPALSWDEYKAQKLQDPELCAAYDALEPEHQRNCAFVEARKAMRKLETPERFHILAERDQDGYWVLSEDHISLTYGDGVTLPAALRDMADVIAEYCAAVRECAAQGNAGDKAQWERVRVWVERKDRMGPVHAIRLGYIVGIALTCGAIGYEVWRLLKRGRRD